MSAPHHVMSFRNGWQMEYRLAPGGGWSLTAVRGEARIEQGERTQLQLLDALDRIDGLPVFQGFLDGLDLGLTKEEASKLIPCDAQGNADRGRVQPSDPAPVVVTACVPVQLSLFDFM